MNKGSHKNLLKLKSLPFYLCKIAIRNIDTYASCDALQDKIAGRGESKKCNLNRRLEIQFIHIHHGAHKKSRYHEEVVFAHTTTYKFVKKLLNLGIISSSSRVK